MPVISVSKMHELASSGALDGRFAAVGGYWMQYALPCAFQPHVAPMSGFCAGGLFADNKADVASYNSSAGSAPLVMPETNSADELQTATGNEPAAVVLIVHRQDARSWQCQTDSRSACAQNLVIDRVAWINGSDTTQAASPANLVAAGEDLITAYRLEATSMNDVDPRFNGEASGQVWYGRTAYGEADANGTRAGVTREVVVATSAIADERTLAVSDKYVPGRVVLDVSQPNPQTASPTPQFSVLDGTTEVVAGDLGMQTPPITLYAATYTLKAAAGSISCSDQISIDPSSDVSFYAKFSKNGCEWDRTDQP